MKKAIVIYCSKRGSTEQYAKWIAEELGEFCSCDLITSEEMKKYNLFEYDLVIYGGWIRGSGIVDFDRFSKLANDEILRKCIVFGVGIANPTPENYMQVWSLNLGKKDPKNNNKATLYILDGAYDPAKISGLDAFLMKISRMVMLSGSTNDASEAATMMRDRIDNGIDLVNRDNIKAIIKEAKQRMNI